jgi:non-heme chloroperoxidase
MFTASRAVDFGASSQPESGYDDQRLADDLWQALNALKLDRPVLAGHSMAGGELTTAGNQHSDRLGGLADPREGPADSPRFAELLKMGPQPKPPACTPDRRSYAAYRGFLQCQMGFPLPEGEIRNTYVANPDGTAGSYKTPQRVFNAIGEGQKKLYDSNIRTPVLALFEKPRTSLDELGADDPQPRNDQERQALLDGSALFKSMVDRWVANLTKSAPNARIVELPRAGNFVFITAKSVSTFSASFVTTDRPSATARKARPRSFSCTLASSLSPR